MSDEPKFSPGPWRWELSEYAKQLQLCGGKRGRSREYDCTVMDFVRWGMRGAAPRFLADDGTRVPLLERAGKFGAVVAGREHHARWFKSVNNPDAHLIAAAPDLYQALSEALGFLQDMKVEGDLPDTMSAALAKARGEQP